MCTSFQLKVACLGSQLVFDFCRWLKLLYVLTIYGRVFFFLEGMEMMRVYTIMRRVFGCECSPEGETVCSCLVISSVVQ